VIKRVELEIRREEQKKRKVRLAEAKRGGEQQIAAFCTNFFTSPIKQTLHLLFTS